MNIFPQTQEYDNAYGYGYENPATTTAFYESSESPAISRPASSANQYEINVSELEEFKNGKKKCNGYRSLKMNFNQKEIYEVTSGSPNDQYEINVSDVEGIEEKDMKDELRKMNSFQHHQQQQQKCDQKRCDVYSSLKMTFEQQQAYEATSSSYEINPLDVEGIKHNEKTVVLKNFNDLHHHQQKSAQKRGDIYKSLKVNAKQEEAYEATSGYEINVMDVEGIDGGSHHQNSFSQPPPYKEVTPGNNRQDYYNITFNPPTTSNTDAVTRTTSAAANQYGIGSCDVVNNHYGNHSVRYNSDGYEVYDTDE